MRSEAGEFPCELSGPCGHLALEGELGDLYQIEKGYEGVGAKDPQSPYVGGRTLKWLKVKQPRYRGGERGRDSRNKS
jgi:hypothetical protein